MVRTCTLGVLARRLPEDGPRDDLVTDEVRREEKTTIVGYGFNTRGPGPLPTVWVL